ncbi:MAG: phosphoglycerate kinase [Methanomassiliicoccus sp.]|nr:phosphoglycerate kinase [Methanomassiliicoccus sp.]
MKLFNTLDDLQFENKTVLLRVDINCPLAKDTLEIEDDNRIRQIIPTVRELLGHGAKVVIIAHQGRPGDWDFAPLEKHAEHLSRYLGKKVRYVDDIVGETAVAEIKDLTPGNAILLKNVRELPYEQDKKSMDEHAKCELVTVLAPLADYFVNDAFATAHRSQCSLVGFPQVLPSAVGRLMEKELTALQSVFDDPGHPSVFILGGAKFGDSIKVIDRLLKSGTADWVILVGLSANAFLTARGIDLGPPSTKFLESELTPETLEAAKVLFKERGDRILLPFDVAVEIDGKRRDMMVGDLPIDVPIYDIGKFSISKFAKVLGPARTIFMSGPAGLIEKEPFCLGTKELMNAMVHSDAFTLIGGGHTVGAAERFGLSEKFSYVSTAGGALETFILGKPLPAIEALKQCRKV